MLGNVDDVADKVPEDFVLATGKTHSVREFAELAFKALGIKLTGGCKSKLELTLKQVKLLLEHKNILDLLR